MQRFVPARCESAPALGSRLRFTNPPDTLLLAIRSPPSGVTAIRYTSPRPVVSVQPTRAVPGCRRQPCCLNAPVAGSREYVIRAVWLETYRERPSGDSATAWA